MDRNESVIIRHRLRQLHATFSMASASELQPGKHGELLLHDQHCLVLPVTGRCEIQIKGKSSHVAEAGGLYYYREGVQTSCVVREGEPFRFYWISFHLDAGSTEFIRLLKLPIRSRIDDPERVKTLFRQLADSRSRRTLSDELKARAVVMELVAFFLEEGLRSGEMLSEHPELQLLSGVLSYIDEHLMDALTVEELAKLAYLHPNYFITYFRSLTGLTPIQYVNQRKIEYARELLDSGELPVQEAARAIGLNNPYFSRLFKQQIGLSPRRYRQLMAERREHLEQQEKQQPALPEAGPWLEEFAWLDEPQASPHAIARPIASLA
ncbi:AraC family transcriptional regulator [Paenibacillus albicereus]|uniref:AraC family transcriptional regulator n=1 Tax=Paenibacillus albicereus TaxID=2726185 RepID=A0A6H2GUF7_9BACL|nr:AraC family transcriptional regulator [Paenibacillus albicereus]QJC51037.1 AraC family transcriptional regulator [Paenibacillus albicereus]